MPGRKYNDGNYRYGFNGKENDKEWGDQLIQDYGLRLYNPAIGKFLSADPLAPEYPFFSPYHFAGNTPIQAIDLDGGEPRRKIRRRFSGGVILVNGIRSPVTINFRQMQFSGVRIIRFRAGFGTNDRAFNSFNLQVDGGYVRSRGIGRRPPGAGTVNMNINIQGGGAPFNIIQNVTSGGPWNLGNFNLNGTPRIQFQLQSTWQTRGWFPWGIASATITPLSSSSQKWRRMRFKLFRIHKNRRGSGNNVLYTHKWRRLSKRTNDNLRAAQTAIRNLPLNEQGAQQYQNILNKRQVFEPTVEAVRKYQRAKRKRRKGYRKGRANSIRSRKGRA